MVSGIGGGIALAKGLNQKIDERRDYTADPRIKAMAAEANLQKSGRMQNIGALERQQEQRGAVAQASYNRAATDASQAFLGAGAVSAQQDQAGMQLAQLEQQDLARRQARADQGTLLQSQERAREIQDAQLKRQEQIATKTQLVSGGLQGLSSAFGGLAAIGTGQSQIAQTQAYTNYLKGGGDPTDASADANSQRFNPSPSSSTPGYSGLMESALELQNVRIRPNMPLMFGGGGN